MSGGGAVGLGPGDDARWESAFAEAGLPLPERVARCGSTNAELRARAVGRATGSAFIAGTQSAGRGRLGREWSSELGNLHMSFLVAEPLPVERLPLVGLVTAVALVEAIGSPLVRLKWPNDVVAIGPVRKVAGILVEIERLGADRSPPVLVVGVGVDVVVAPQGVPAASLRELGVDLELPELAASVVAGARDLVGALVAGETRAVLDRYRSHALLGCPVTVSGRPGVAVDVTPDGALRFRPDDGPEEVVRAGDVAMIEGMDEGSWSALR
jgi:BirA family biotin operon repressor/biotin-[acetyl-CoA-carboxylase] ligase